MNEKLLLLIASVLLANVFGIAWFGAVLVGSWQGAVAGGFVGYVSAKFMINKILGG